MNGAEVDYVPAWRIAGCSLESNWSSIAARQSLTLPRSTASEPALQAGNLCIDVSFR